MSLPVSILESILPVTDDECGVWDMRHVLGIESGQKPLPDPRI